MLIHQIHLSDNNFSPSEYTQNKIKELREVYSDYEYKLWDNNSIEKLLEENFNPEVLNAYRTIRAYTFKADLARYCILYVMGGYYYDVDICPLFKFEPDIPLIFKGINELKYTQGNDVFENNVLYFKERGHPFLKRAIDKCVENILALNYTHHPLGITSHVMLPTLDHSDIVLGAVEHRENGFISIYDGVDIFYHKPKSELSYTGTNDYTKMWFDSEIFNLKFSYVVSTNGNKPKTTKACLKSLLDIMTENDEVIFVGNTEFLKEFESNQVILYHDMELATNRNVSQSRNLGIQMSSGNIIVDVDDDMMFPQEFQNNMIKYIKQNKYSFDTFNVKTVLPSGGRWWDRMIYIDGKSIMVDYDKPYDERLAYPAAILIWKKTIALEIPWDETHLYYDPVKDNEDMKLSQDLKKAGYKIKIDCNNWILHVDFSYMTYVDDIGQLTGGRKKDVKHRYSPIKDTTYHKQINELLKKYVKEGALE